MGLKRVLETSLAGSRYTWAKTLNWHDGTIWHQSMPEPWQEISWMEWWRQSISGHEIMIVETFDQWFLDGANTMFPSKSPEYVVGNLWALHCRVYSSGVWAVATAFRWSHSPRAIVPDPSKALWVPSQYPHARARADVEDAPFTGTGYINRFFRIGCEHKHQSGKQLANCLREYTCTECGYTYQIDSSD